MCIINSTEYYNFIFSKIKNIPTYVYVNKVGDNDCVDLFGSSYIHNRQDYMLCRSTKSFLIRQFSLYKLFIIFQTN